MRLVKRKGRETDRDVISPGLVRCAVAHPFACDANEANGGRQYLNVGLPLLPASRPGNALSIVELR